MAQPRTERKRLHNLPVHQKRRQISSHLSADLHEKYGRRSVVLRKGDTVKVMRGEFAGATGKVLLVDTRTRKVEVEDVTVAKADKTKVARQLDASNLMITKLDLTDRLRRQKLGATEADIEREPAAAAPAAAAADEGSDGPEDEEKPKPVRGARRKKGEKQPDEEEA